MADDAIPPEKKQQWAEEVVYLHSLWHQNPNPNSRKRKAPSDQSQPSNPPPSHTEWPTNPHLNPNPAAGWSEFTRNPESNPPKPVKDHTKLNPSRLHNNAIKFCRHFFGNNSDDDSDDDEDGESEDGAYAFLLKLFETDDELREYYEKNYEDGGFFCLVCVGLGIKVGKTYKDCKGLVQHATSVTKKGKAPHRALGRVVCRVLGWDVSRLPNIVLDLAGTLGQSLAEAKKAKDELKKQNDACVKQRDLQKEHGSKDIAQVPNNELKKLNDASVKLVDLQKEHGVKEIAQITNKDSISVELSSCVEIKEPAKQPATHNNTESISCIKAVEPSLTINSKGSGNDKVLKCTEVKDLPGLPTHSNPKSSEENKWKVSSSKTSIKVTGWPDIPSEPLKTPLTMAEQARDAALRLQQNGIRAFEEFLKKDASPDNAGDYDDAKENQRKEEALKFFTGLFERERGLRIYYEKNWRKGEFCCLVCRGIGAKLDKTYKNCVRVVSHSTSALRVMHKSSHQGYANALCSLLGWDINNLPNPKIDAGESSAQPIAKPEKTQTTADDEGKKGEK